MPEQWRFVVIWEFRVRPQAKAGFETAYGPQGEWARLFSQAKEYCGTELIADGGDSRRYLTLDYWQSQEAYEKFLTSNEASYRGIDERCEKLTESERQIGRFTRAG